MFQFSLTRLFMAVTLVAILVALTQSRGRGPYYAWIECISFSADSSKMMVSRSDARSSNVPYKSYLSDVSRTLSVFDLSDDLEAQVIHEDFLGGNQGPGSSWRTRRTSALIHPAGDRLLVRDFGGGGISSYSLEAEANVKRFISMQPMALNIAVSPEGSFLAASGGPMCYLVDIEQDSALLTIQRNEIPFENASFFSFSQDETHLAILSLDGIELWDLESGNSQPVASLQEPYYSDERRIDGIHFLADGSLVVHSTDWVRIYAQDSEMLREYDLAGLQWPMLAAVQGERVAVGDYDSVIVLDAYSGELISRFAVKWPNYLTMTPDGKTVVVADKDGWVELFDAETGKSRWRMKPPGNDRVTWRWPSGFLVTWFLVAYFLYRRKRKAGRRTRDDNAASTPAVGLASEGSSAPQPPVAG